MKRALTCLLVALTAGFLTSGAAQASLAGPGWTPAASMSASRNFHHAILLPNGKVLVLGGQTEGAPAILYNPATNSWSNAPDPAASTGGGDNPVLLQSGKVLYGTEIYNPVTNGWSATAAALERDRAGGLATVLKSGKVLVAGGFWTLRAELYDPTTNHWSGAGTMSAFRYSHTATLLPSGKVLVAGGDDFGDVYSPGLSSAELYDPSRNSWSAAASMAEAHFLHQAALLPNGKVLVVGGGSCSLSRCAGTSSAELYNPPTNTWSSAGRLTRAGDRDAATLLQSGKVLVTGGAWGHFFGTDDFATAEQYDPATNTWASAGCMSTGRAGHTATLLQNGKVLVAGGSYLATAELYTPTSVPAGSGCVFSVWGWNGEGEWGEGPDGYQFGRGTPCTYCSPGYLLSVSAGFSAVAALTRDGEVWSWGDNSLGQLGDGSTTNSSGPIRARGLTGVKAISFGKSHVLALRTNGTVWSWGNNSAGQLGYGSACGHDCAGSKVPRQVPGLSNIVAVAAGGFHSLALRSDGRLFAWGQGGQGQLGNGYLKNTTAPIVVPGLTGLTIKTITASVYDSMVITSAGRVWGWGGNGYGEVRGDGKIGIRSTPIEVPIANVAAIAQGTYFTVAAKTDGSVWTWGRNDHGQLGRGTVNTPTWDGIPKRVPGLSGQVTVAAGRAFALVLGRDGKAHAWGSGTSGELWNGNYAPEDRATPQEIGIHAPLRAIAAGGYHAVAIQP